MNRTDFSSCHDPRAAAEETDWNVYRHQLILAVFISNLVLLVTYQTLTVGQEHTSNYEPRDLLCTSSWKRSIKRQLWSAPWSSAPPCPKQDLQILFGRLNLRNFISGCSRQPTFTFVTFEGGSPHFSYRLLSAHAFYTILERRILSAKIKIKKTGAWRNF